MIVLSWYSCFAVEDQEALRAQLKDNGLVAFVVNGAILPRVAGDSDLPLAVKIVLSIVVALF
jgi:predicted ABC-class ATPase